ncbi:ATP-binding cassette domain-containing protein [Catellatospora sp. NPDC049133]|uniref:ATP-binding cassette domain-containing protein n=1 Tax=Catellatospora sp. NPDC049133 TaxID=3155499 RepID=UPI0033C1F406
MRLILSTRLLAATVALGALAACGNGGGTTPASADASSRTAGEPCSTAKAARTEKVLDLLRSVGVPEPEPRAQQYPHQPSGGLRQRALIASAIACGPRLLIADEPTAALDATVQAQVLELLGELQERLGIAYLFISHDLGVIHHVSDRVLVMKDGAVVGSGDVRQIFTAPVHEYTRRLLSAVLTPVG